MSERVYIHEFVDIVGHGRAAYLQHVTANWAPIGRDQRRQLCFGVWGVIGSTGRWPQVVNVWEYASWDDLAHNFEIEVQGAGLQDPSLESWWADAAALRSGGFDRIMVAPSWSPSIGELCTGGGLGAAGYVHELIACRAGSARDVLDAVHAEGIEACAGLGLRLVAAMRRAMANDDEVVLIWSFEDWPTWARAESAMDDPGSGARGWRGAIAEQVTGWERILLADAPLSPLRTGRQP